MLKYIPLAAALCTLALPTAAEERTYGNITLTGLARESWGYNAPGYALTMVCNVNGPDGFLSIRSGPGTDHSVIRMFNRLATVEVDTRERRGNWVKVTSAYRNHTEDGEAHPLTSLKVEGWAHDGYLCDFIDH
ncbi:SH3 domain-containing protein [Alphaproteobacteria bacterium KMM 3653]|uniref:SH3 domain-containing protein n=1 Tax=Harenicola maris TaxID=2841044 RepID=A0AAP2CQA8_9RHOB|nr:SH3 domain-containing protein [Harenicola maris]